MHRLLWCKHGRDGTNMVTAEFGSGGARGSRGAARASCGARHPGAWALPGTWRGCVGSRGASSEGAPRGEVAGGQARGCTAIFGSTELWAGQTLAPVRPQPHFRVRNGGSFRPPLASRSGVAGTTAAQPSRPPPFQAPTTPGGPSAWLEEMLDVPCSPHSISHLCWTYASCQGQPLAPRTLKRSGPGPGSAFL